MPLLLILVYLSLMSLFRLDPLAIADLTDLLAGGEAAKGKSILMSTHVLILQRKCDRFVILHQGQVRAVDFGRIIWKNIC